MIDDKRLAEIEERAGKATRGPWLDAFTGTVWVNDGSNEIVADFRPKHRAGTPLSDEAGTLRSACFAAHARQDVPDLCASLREAWHLIWIMSQDQEAYLRGKEDGRREEREAVARWLQEVAWGVTDASYEEKLTVLAKALTSYIVQTRETLPPPMPPDALMAENARLTKMVQDLLNRTSQKID